MYHIPPIIPDVDNVAVSSNLLEFQGTESLGSDTASQVRGVSLNTVHSLGGSFYALLLFSKQGISVSIGGVEVAGSPATEIGQTFVGGAAVGAWQILLSEGTDTITASVSALASGAIRFLDGASFVVNSPNVTPTFTASTKVFQNIGTVPMEGWLNLDIPVSNEAAYAAYIATSAGAVKAWTGVDQSWDAGIRSSFARTSASGSNRTGHIVSVSAAQTGAAETDLAFIGVAVSGG